MTTQRTIQFPAEQVTPRGSSEDAARAVECLGPFDEQVEREVPWENNKPAKLTPQLAREHVDGLAVSYLEHEYLARRAPRRSKVAKELIELTELSKAISERLCSADDFTLAELQAEAQNSRNLDWLPKIISQAEVASLPMPGDAHRKSSLWVRRFDALNIYLRHCTRVYTLGSKTVDEGGRRNTFTWAWGVPRCALAMQGWYVFDFYKPGQATGTEDGPFHEFLDAVFENATGLQSEDHAHLISWIKTVCKVNNRNRELDQRLERLEAERRSLSPKPKPSRRLRKIWAEQDAIMAERETLLPRLPPFEVISLGTVLRLLEPGSLPDS